jgi:hypothetical protein
MNMVLMRITIHYVEYSGHGCVIQKFTLLVDNILATIICVLFLSHAGIPPLNYSVDTNVYLPVGMQVRPSVTFMISEPCPCCHGIGRVEALDTSFSKIEREICRRLVSLKTYACLLSVLSVPL